MLHRLTAPELIIPKVATYYGLVRHGGRYAESAGQDRERPDHPPHGDRVVVGDVERSLPR